MRFHAPSFLLGVGVTATVVATRARLHPIAVEVAALGVHLARLARGVTERRREDLEDFWAEVEQRVRTRPEEPEPRAYHAAQNGAPRA